jgi:hypothetical protein
VLAKAHADGSYDIDYDDHRLAGSVLIILAGEGGARQEVCTIDKN